MFKWAWYNRKQMNQQPALLKEVKHHHALRHQN